ncbi:hypothetical protein BDZ89DRAFT_1053166 [Hymenopellis radicata]|nr:hypothetical protein BDZ89DRAFT_1053166 [Hymenopellis radicata]
MKGGDRNVMVQRRGTKRKLGDHDSPWSSVTREKLSVTPQQGRMEAWIHGKQIVIDKRLGRFRGGGLSRSNARGKFFFNSTKCKVLGGTLEHRRAYPSRSEQYENRCHASRELSVKLPQVSWIHTPFSTRDEVEYQMSVIWIDHQQFISNVFRERYIGSRDQWGRGAST